MVKYRRTHAAYRDELWAHSAWQGDALICNKDWRGKPIISPNVDANLAHLSDFLTTQIGEPVRVEHCEGFFAVSHVFNGNTISTGLYVEEAAIHALDCMGGKLC